MTDTERRQRADAQRNRKRVLEAAEACFCERGLDVGVGEIAELAGVGRGTLFRNFPTKQDLIAAIVVEHMLEAERVGRELLQNGDGGEQVFEFISHIVGRQQVDRALFDAVADAFLMNPEIRAAQTQVITVLDELLARAKQAGTVRADVGAVDVLMMVKGVCAAAASLGGVSPEILERHLDLVRAAISTPGHEHQLRGRPPTMSDLERAHRTAATPAAGEQKPAA